MAATTPTIAGFAPTINNFAPTIGEEPIMKLQFNINNAGGTLAGWNETSSSTLPLAGAEIFSAGSLVDDNNDSVAGASFWCVQKASSVIVTNYITAYPYTITAGANTGNSVNDTDWPAPHVTGGAYYVLTGVEQEYEIRGLAAGTYTVKVYAGARDSTGTRSGNATITGDGAGPVTGVIKASELTENTVDRVLVGSVEVADTINILVDFISTGGYLAGITVEQTSAATAPTLTTPYADLINLNTDVVAGVNLNTNITGETSLVVTWDPAIPSGLSETAGVVSGTVTVPTGTSICTVTGTNSFGSIESHFQWTTLTTGDPSTGINETINS